MIQLLLTISPIDTGRTSLFKTTACKYLRTYPKIRKKTLIKCRRKDQLGIIPGFCSGKFTISNLTNLENLLIELEMRQNQKGCQLLKEIALKKSHL